MCFQPEQRASRTEMFINSFYSYSEMHYVLSTILSAVNTVVKEPHQLAFPRGVYVLIMLKYKW